MFVYDFYQSFVGTDVDGTLPLQPALRPAYTLYHSLVCEVNIPNTTPHFMGYLRKYLELQILIDINLYGRLLHLQTMIFIQYFPRNSYFVTVYTLTILNLEVSFESS
jgi:hypothetical protein